MSNGCLEFAAGYFVGKDLIEGCEKPACCLLLLVGVPMFLAGLEHGCEYAKKVKIQDTKIEQEKKDSFKVEEKPERWIESSTGEIIIESERESSSDVHKEIYQQPKKIEKRRQQLENIINPNAQSRTSSFLLKQIEYYQQNISPKLHEKLKTESICKYEPSCSEYAKQAIEKYGAFRGSILATGRLLRCNSLSRGGYNPLT